SGVVGNALNMFVLRDTKRRRAYFLFNGIALSDILFFVVLMPSWLASYEIFAQDLIFRQILFTVKVTCFGIANWLSAINIWVVCVISLERYSAVHDPMKHKRMCGLANRHILFAILIVTFICTSYIHYNTHCKIKEICSGTQLAQVCVDVRANWNSWRGMNTTPEWMRQLIGVMRYVHAGMAIAAPLILVCVFNGLLIHHAKRIGFSFDGSGTQTNLQRAENRITYIAIVIISVFLITNLPSAVILVFHTVYPFSYPDDSPK
ncbi:hypothetical protein PENTCL1PPCAC_10879, partial [Pristionchus entomophagus]